jgi:hypothetical protein
MNLNLIEAAEEVLAGFREVVKLTEQAALEERSPYGLIGGALVLRGIDLDDSRIASHLSPTAQLIEQLVKGKAECRVEDDARPRVKLYNRSGHIWLTLPSALSDLEHAWWAGWIADLLPEEVAVDGNAKRDPYWDFPHPVADSDRW